MTSINTNIGALIAQKNMMENNKELDQAMSRISSGLRINSAADDAAGSAIASKMESQVRSLGVAIRNANDAISLTQTAEGSLGEIENILQRMRELAVQAGNSTLNASDRSQIQSEMDQLASEIDSISSKANFNGVKLLDGSKESIQMQIGIDATDTLKIDLQKTTVGSLGIGNSGSSGGNVIVSERMTTLVDQAAGDIKINGEDAFASTFDVNSTSVKGVTDNVSGAVNGTNANNGQYGALALATKINTNTSNHGVTADAFNEVRAGTNVYTAESFAINAITVTSQNTKELWVAEVNAMVTNVSASIDSEGFIVYSNTDGAAINFAANSQGIATDNYGGFVRLTSNTNTPITIEAGSEENGYGADTGNAVDVANIGFNEVRRSADGVGLEFTGSNGVDETVLQGSDGVRINDVLITKLAHQTSTSVHAQDKVAAINAKTSEHGVVASAQTGVIIGVDLSTPTMTNHADVAINGITVNMTSVDTTKELIDTINTALVGKTDVVASLHTDGNMKLLSATGATITFDDDVDSEASGALFKSAVNLDGTAILAISGDPYATAAGHATIQGRITLTSLDGSSIKLTDDLTDRLAGAGGVGRIGFESMNEFRDAGSTGVVISSVEAASTSLKRLDDAIETISQFRSGFGAYENRLDASISNLTTLQVNTDAARSRIEDADFASETSNMTKAQILSQAATSMLAQANASKQNLLALLQG